MNNSSYFIKGKAMFGSYPSQEAVQELEKEGVRFFVDLTFPDERKILPYTTKYNYLRFPITDCKAPRDWRSFAQLVVHLANVITGLGNEERVYIHCKGGHGRSGVVVACLLCYIFKIDPSTALQRTSASHSKRSVMRDKWRKIGSPQTYHQKNFVHKFFSPLKFHRPFRHGHTAGFSTLTAHPVTIPGLGTFPTAEAAIQAHKAAGDVEYIKKLKTVKSPSVAIAAGNAVDCPEWSEIEQNVTYLVLREKFDQYPELKSALLDTGLRQIVQCYSSEEHGPSENSSVGKALMELRSHYYLSEHQVE